MIKRHKQNGHSGPDILRPSPPDLVGLAKAVQERFEDLVGSYLRIKGASLVLPGSMKPAVLLYQRMMSRWSVGLWKHTDSEKKALREFAQYTLDQNCELRNQPKQELQWSD